MGSAAQREPPSAALSAHTISRRTALFGFSAAAWGLTSSDVQAFSRFRSRGATVQRGRFVIVGRNPDGDSVRFLPQGAHTLSRGTQLRLEGIDAPELHYEGQSQPLAKEARDALLTALGFHSVTFGRDGRVARAEPPQGVAGWIVTRYADRYHRPLALVFRAEAMRSLPSSVNHRLVLQGAAYPAFYRTLPEAHREVLREAAVAARLERRGVWRRDSSGGFTLEDEQSLGEEGQLILPKLYRRCCEYLEGTRRGFEGTFPQWLGRRRSPRGLRRSRAFTEHGPERVWVKGRERTLAELVSQTGSRVALEADPLDLVFD